MSTLRKRPRAPAVTTALARRRPPGTTISLEALAREAGVHPELARRLIRLGLLDTAGGRAESPLFPRDAAALLARAVRLRRDLGLNYAGAILACSLLKRIDELEARLRVIERLEVMR